MSDLLEIYTHFIYYEQMKKGQVELRPIGELVNVLGEQDYKQCNILLWK